jgi:hypothetical protein
MCASFARGFCLEQIDTEHTMPSPYGGKDSWINLVTARKLHVVNVHISPATTQLFTFIVKDARA